MRQRCASAREAIAELAQDGHRVAVVHGGGSALTRMLKQLGKQSEFVGGLRVTDAETRDVALMVLGGMVNKKTGRGDSGRRHAGDRILRRRRHVVPRARKNMSTATIWDLSARFASRNRAGSKRCGSKAEFRCWRRSLWAPTANTTT